MRASARNLSLSYRLRVHVWLQWRLIAAYVNDYPVMTLAIVVLALLYLALFARWNELGELAQWSPLNPLLFLWVCTWIGLVIAFSMFSEKRGRNYTASVLSSSPGFHVHPGQASVALLASDALVFIPLMLIALLPLATNTPGESAGCGVFGLLVLYALLLFLFFEALRYLTLLLAHAGWGCVVILLYAIVVYSLWGWMPVFYFSGSDLLGSLGTVAFNAYFPPPLAAAVHLGITANQPQLALAALTVLVVETALLAALYYLLSAAYFVLRSTADTWSARQESLPARPVRTEPLIPQFLLRLLSDRHLAELLRTGPPRFRYRLASWVTFTVLVGFIYAGSFGSLVGEPLLTERSAIMIGLCCLGVLFAIIGLLPVSLTPYEVAVITSAPRRLVMRSFLFNGVAGSLAITLPVLIALGISLAWPWWLYILCTAYLLMVALLQIPSAILATLISSRWFARKNAREEIVPVVPLEDFVRLVWGLLVFAGLQVFALPLYLLAWLFSAEIIAPWTAVSVAVLLIPYAVLYQRIAIGWCAWAAEYKEWDVYDEPLW